MNCQRCYDKRVALCSIRCKCLISALSCFRTVRLVVFREILGSQTDIDFKIGVGIALEELSLFIVKSNADGKLE